jgi:DNA-binding transcriptional MerR regulator/mannose-6-phosphate isomerase-like protein (cupin superfamily)
MTGGDQPLARIGVVARAVGVSASTIRSWEREGLISPLRADGHHRRFTSEQVDDLRRIAGSLRRGTQRRVLRRALTGTPRGEVAGSTGPRLRALRIRAGHSLRKVAQTAGISASYLSMIERGLAAPGVAMLQKIAAATGITVLEFFEAKPGSAGAKLVRPADRRTLQGFDGVEMEDLVGFPSAAMQVEIFTVRPGGGSGGGYAHDGEEAIFMLDGRVTVWLDDDEAYELEAGDCLYFRSTQQHRWHNPGAEPARLFWVNTPPTF